MSGRQPGSTLFPYTTLFRSEAQQEAEGEGEGARGKVECDPMVEVQRTRHHDHDDGDDRADPERDGEDRKSTRLNSSHRCISYAVFCLKKKTKKSAAILCDNE